MKNLLIISLIIIFSSCEKKGYDLKVSDTEPLLIVDGRVEKNTKKVKISLTKSTDFFGDNPIDYVNDASVFLSVNGEGEQQLIFIDSGAYEIENVLVDEGTKYDLRIVDGQEEYTSTSTMLNLVPIDVFSFSEPTISFGKALEDTTQYLNFDMLLNIDLSQTNYYITETKVVLNTNPEFFNNEEAYLFWDDGSYVSNPAFFPYFVSDFPELSRVNVRFSHISKETFDFYSSLDDVAGQSPSSIAPANPTSNISNGAVGSFGAYATFDTTIVVTL